MARAESGEQLEMKYEKIDYKHLNARQKENFNFQKVSAVLADYGFVTLRLSDDWEGADFIAQHINGRVIRVQLKSRLAFYEKYRGRTCISPSVRTACGICIHMMSYSLN